MYDKDKEEYVWQRQRRIDITNTQTETRQRQKQKGAGQIWDVCQQISLWKGVNWPHSTNCRWFREWRKKNLFQSQFLLFPSYKESKKETVLLTFLCCKKYAIVFFTAAPSSSLGLRHEIYFSTKEICHLRFCRFLFGSCSSFLVFSKLSRRPPPQTPRDSELLSSTVMQSSISRGYF